MATAEPRCRRCCHHGPASGPIMFGLGLFTFGFVPAALMLLKSLHQLCSRVSIPWGCPQAPPGHRAQQKWPSGRRKRG